MKPRAWRPELMGVPLLVLALLAGAAAVLQRRRIREYIDGRSTLDDDMIRRIEERGSLEMDDPTDMDEVRQEEERFWSETWDVPDEE